MDVVDNIWIFATAKNIVYSKAHMLIAPNSSGLVTKFENCTLKEALFEFLATIDRKYLYSCVYTQKFTTKSFILEYYNRSYITPDRMIVLLVFH